MVCSSYEEVFLMKNKERFIEEINEKLRTGLKFGEGKKFTEELAKKYKIKPNTAIVYFYEQKKIFEKKNPTNSLEEKLSNVPIEYVKKEEYVINDEVEFTVTGFKSFGVIGETCDKAKVLLHISKIKDEYIANMHLYFKIGDNVNAKIEKITPEGELRVTTIGYSLPYYLVTKEKNELDEIEKYLKPIIGEMSENAKDEFQKFIEEKGLFKVTLELAKRVPTFKPDLGLVLLNEIKKHWNDGL